MNVHGYFQSVELSQSATMSLGSLKRSMPIQLSLSIGPTLGTAQATQQIQQAGKLCFIYDIDSDFLCFVVELCTVLNSDA